MSADRRRKRVRFAEKDEAAEFEVEEPARRGRFEDEFGFEEEEEEEEDDEPSRMTEAVVGEEETTVNEAGLEPFNLRSERENDGFFDANGNFVWRREKEEPDAWLAQLDEAATEKGIGESSKRRIVEEKDEEVDVEGAARTLGSLLVNGETVAGALRRLGKDLPASRTDFDTLASLADILVRAGKDVYDQTAEAFLPPDTRTWEYKGADGQIHGPFATKHILAWRSAGFFVGDMAVPMRECAAAETDDFLADLEEEEEEEEERDWRSSGTIDFFAPKQPLLLERSVRTLK